MSNKLGKQSRPLEGTLVALLLLGGLTACEGAAAIIATEPGYPPPGLTASPTSVGYPPPATLEPTSTRVVEFPAVDTPDPTMAALAMTIPACCEGSLVATLSPTETAWSTQVALTSQPPATVAATLENPNTTYLSPSEKWVLFTHAKQLYSFTYPENWFVSYQSSGQIVTLSNFPLTQVEKNIDSPNRFRLDIYSSGGFEGYTSLITFADAQKLSGSQEKVVAETAQQLDNGYLVLRRHLTTPLNREIFEMWVTNGQAVYQMVTPSVNSQFNIVHELILKSFVIQLSP
jgi:hypothetical protein